MLDFLTKTEVADETNPGNEKIFVSVIFPIADLRPFLCPETAILLKPFHKRTSDAYVRRFGSGKYRLLQRDHDVNLTSRHGWFAVDLKFPPALAADENWFVTAKRFLHVPNAPVQPRLFADGFISARLEVPLVIAELKDLKAIPELVHDLLHKQVELRSSRPGKRSPARQDVPLAQVGQHFRIAFLAATTPEPVRREARDNPKSEVALAAKGALLSLEPVVLVVTPLSWSSASKIALHFGVVKTENTSFRLLTICPRSTDDLAIVRQARRSFTRLYTEGSAILKLVEQLETKGVKPTITEKSAKRLQALADRLVDASVALQTDKGASIPLLGELGPTVSAAANQLAAWLDEFDPNAGRTQRRLAKALLRAAPVGSTVEVVMGDKFSDIRNSTIVNRSFVEKAFNNVNKQDQEAAKALLEVSKLVAKSGDQEAGQLLDQFNEELAKPEPRKSLLKRSWDGLVQILPTIKEVAGAAAAIAKLFV